MMYIVLQVHICLVEEERVNNFSETIGGRMMERRETILIHRREKKEEEREERERERERGKEKNTKRGKESE